MAEPTREQYAELHDRIAAALPVDRDGTCITGYDPQGCLEWGSPTRVVAAIEGAFRQMDLHVVPGAEFDRLTHQRDRLMARLAAVDALHQPNGQRVHGEILCHGCADPWPCPTNQAAQEDAHG